MNTIEILNFTNLIEWFSQKENLLPLVIDVVIEGLKYISPIIAVTIAIYFKKIWKIIINRFARPITEENDNFATITFAIRFPEIFDKINNNISGYARKNFKIMWDSTLKEDVNENLIMIPDISEKSKKILKNWYTDLIERMNITKHTITVDYLKLYAPFIDMEHFFYFHILSQCYKESNISEQNRQEIDKYYDKSSVKSESLKLYYTNVKTDNSVINDRELLLTENKFYFDPFKTTKIHDIDEDLKRCENSRIISSILRYQNIKLDSNALSSLLSYNLMGNSFDLSQHTKLAMNEITHVVNVNNQEINNKKSSNNDIHNFCDYIKKCQSRSNKQLNVINYLVDNVGVELLHDLILADYLFNELQCKINFYVNEMPIFVSDVISNDIICLLNRISIYIESNDFCNNPNKNVIKKYIDSIRNRFINNNFEIKSNFYFNMPMRFKDWTKDPNDNMTANEIFRTPNSLVIVKGDLNYRRLVGDFKSSLWRKEKYKLPDYTSYIKSPLLVIRSFKSNVILDIDKDYAKKLDMQDTRWRNNGTHGTIRFLDK